VARTIFTYILKHGPFNAVLFTLLTSITWYGPKRGDILQQELGLWIANIVCHNLLSTLWANKLPTPYQTLITHYRTRPCPLHVLSLYQ